MLNRLISWILIGEVKKVDGQKMQEVRIVYNFVGKSRKLQHKDSEALPMPGRANYIPNHKTAIPNKCGELI